MKRLVIGRPETAEGYKHEEKVRKLKAPLSPFLPRVDAEEDQVDGFSYRRGPTLTFEQQKALREERRQRAQEDLDRREAERVALANGATVPPRISQPVTKRARPATPAAGYARREGVQADYGLEGVFAGSRARSTNASGAEDPSVWDVVSARSSNQYFRRHPETGNAHFSKMNFHYPAARLLGGLRQIVINAPVTRVIDELRRLDEERFPSSIFNHVGQIRADPNDHPLPGGRAAARYIELERALGQDARPGAFLRRTVEMNYEGLIYLMSCRGELALDPMRMPADYREPIISSELESIRARLEADQDLIDGTGDPPPPPPEDEDPDPVDPTDPVDPEEPPQPMPLEERRRLEAILEGGAGAVLHEWLRDEMRRVRDRVGDEGLTDDMIKNWSYSTLFDYHENVYAKGRWDGLTRIGGGVVRWGHAMIRVADELPPCSMHLNENGDVISTCHHRSGAWVHPDPAKFFHGMWPAFYSPRGNVVPPATGVFDIHFVRPEGDSDVWYLDVLRWL